MSTMIPSFIDIELALSTAGLSSTTWLTAAWLNAAWLSPVAMSVVWMLAKISLLLAAAAIAHAIVQRRTSAATRHLLWTLAAAGLLILPLLSVALPGWAVTIPIASAPATASQAFSVEQTNAAQATVARATLSAPALRAAPERARASSPDRVRPSRSAAQPIESRAAAQTPIDPIESSGAIASAGPLASDASGSASGASEALGAPRVQASTAPAATRVPWTTVLLMLYAAGALLLLARLALERLAVARLARQATEVHDPDWRALFADCAERMQVDHAVRLLRSRDRTMPMTFGTRRPVILIPAIADTWSADRRRAVLLHELAHVARYDCLTQMMATIACALYWVHPGVWWVARRLRVERELACDDRVLTVGTHARDYAGHLLEIAYSLGGGRAPALVVSMARPRQLEGRMLAVLDDTRNRATPRLRSRLAGVAMTAALLLPLAGAEATVVSVSAVSADEALYPTDPASARRMASLAPAASNARPAPAVAAPTDIASAPTPAPAPTATSEEPGSPQGGGRERAAQSSAASANPQDRLPGTWEVRPATDKPGSVYIRLTESRPDGGNWSSGTTMPLDRLEGLTQTQIAGSTGPVTFNVRRDAGTFTFEGIFRNGVGAGTYTFAPNPGFPAELAKRGFQRPNAAEQYELARADVGFAFIDELTTQGYERPELADLVRAGQHGVRLDYLKEMGGFGYRLGFLDALIKQHDHGVTPQFIRDLAAAGFQHLTPEEIMRARDHGVSPDYLNALRDAGYRSLNLDQAVTARDHGVNAEFIKEMGAQGYTKLTLEALTNARDHGVSAEFARELKELGYTVTLDEMIKARDHGVSSEFIRDLNAAGYTKLSMDSLVRIRDHGVSAKYARELKELGYDRIEINDLIELRNHGVTVERVRAANARAGTHLPLDMIKALADGGLR